jgi:prevent-host-death family protein
VSSIPLRQLKNHPSEVLRRVEAGERLTVTVSGRPVAELSPVIRRERWVPVARARAALEGLAPDPGLAREVAEAFPDTTDEL